MGAVLQLAGDGVQHGVDEGLPAAGCQQHGLAEVGVCVYHCTEAAIDRLGMEDWRVCYSYPGWAVPVISLDSILW